MINLYYAYFASEEEGALIEKYKSKVDLERLEKVMRIRAEKAKVRSLLAGYLLQVGVKEFLLKDEDVLSLKYSYREQGKPYLAEYPQIHFNLSHSGNVAACAVADDEIGMDVQVFEKGKEGIAGRFFTKEEQETLEKAKESGNFEALFFAYWSIKESYLKYTGLGMKQGLDTFGIDFKNKRIIDLCRKEKEPVFFEQIRLPGLPEYALSICSGCREKEIKVLKIPL